MSQIFDTWDKCDQCGQKYPKCNQKSFAPRHDVKGTRLLCSVEIRDNEGQFYEGEFCSSGCAAIWVANRTAAMPRPKS